MKNLATLIQDAVAHKNIVDGKFDETLAQIQNLLGIPTGDVAGVFFAGKEKEWVEMTHQDKLKLIQEYILFEVNEIFEN